MANSEMTPCGALFDVMKRFCGVSYKELAGLILSGRPLSDGRSPVSRVGDRTWVSRFIVHAPAGSLQERYFCDFGVGALRIMARLRARGRRSMTNAQVIDMLHDQGIPAMVSALNRLGEDASVLRNVFERLIGGSGYSDDERAEVAMVLFVAAGCTGSARRAAAYALEYAQSSHGGKLAATPAIMMRSESNAPSPAPLPLALGLVRVQDGYVKGSPHWVAPDCAEVVIGALALGEHDIADVGCDASGRHAKLRCDEGLWSVQDLGSSNGTVVANGATGERVAVVPNGQPVEVHAGDTLMLGGDTTYVIIEGLPEA